MKNLDFESLQKKAFRPGRLCLHCGRCMPIIDGENLNTSEITPNDFRGPISVWDEYPIECGYTGWLFWEREKQKHLVRKIKEEIHMLSLLDKNTLVAKETTAAEKIANLLEQIQPWNKYGAQNW